MQHIFCFGYEILETPHKLEAITNDSKFRMGHEADPYEKEPPGPIPDGSKRRRKATFYITYVNLSELRPVLKLTPRPVLIPTCCLSLRLRPDMV